MHAYIHIYTHIYIYIYICICQRYTYIQIHKAGNGRSRQVSSYMSPTLSFKPHELMSRTPSFDAQDIGAIDMYHLTCHQIYYSNLTNSCHELKGLVIGAIDKTRRIICTSSTLLFKSHELMSRTP